MYMYMYIPTVIDTGGEFFFRKERSRGLSVNNIDTSTYWYYFKTLCSDYEMI